MGFFAVSNSIYMQKVCSCTTLWLCTLLCRNSDTSKQGCTYRRDISCSCTTCCFPLRKSYHQCSKTKWEYRSPSNWVLSEATFWVWVWQVHIFQLHREWLSNTHPFKKFLPLPQPQWTHRWSAAGTQGKTSVWVSKDNDSISGASFSNNWVPH